MPFKDCSLFPHSVRPTRARGNFEALNGWTDKDITMPFEFVINRYAMDHFRPFCLSSAGCLGLRGPAAGGEMLKSNWGWEQQSIHSSSSSSIKYIHNSPPNNSNPNPFMPIKPTKKFANPNSQLSSTVHKSMLFLRASQSRSSPLPLANLTYSFCHL